MNRYSIAFLAALGGLGFAAADTGQCQAAAAPRRSPARRRPARTARAS